LSTTLPRTYLILAIQLLVIAGSALALTAPLPEPISEPHISVPDLDFGMLRIGEVASRTLRFSNDSGGVLTFNNPSGGADMEWLDGAFSVEQGELAKLSAARLGRNEFLDIVVTFTATQVGEHRDTARVWASTRNGRDVSHWVARVVTPGPQITGYDWEEQPLLIGPCQSAASPTGSKHSSAGYRSEIYVFNTGDAPFVVDRVELQGADANFFALDNSDPIKSVRNGDQIRPFDEISHSPKHYQSVLFRPGSAERVYSCEVVIHTTDGQSATNTLRGIGVESHIEAPDAVVFGRSLFVPDAPGIERTVSFSTATTAGLGSRPVTITGVSIVPADPGAAGQFTIMNADALVGRTFAARSTIDVVVEYRPTAPGNHTAELVLTGDFSPCDDSTATLVGGAMTLSARPEGRDYGAIPTCFDTTDNVSIENDGSDPIVVYGMNEIRDVGGAFRYAQPTLPDTLMPGERMVLRVTFAPNGVGSFSGIFEFVIRDLGGTSDVLFNGGPVIARVSGDGVRHQSTAHIERTYHGDPGDSLGVDVVLDQPIDEPEIDALDFSIRYARGVLESAIDFDDLGAMVAGTLLEGWGVEVQFPPTSDPANRYQYFFLMRLTAPPGAALVGAGTLLRLPFRLVAGDTTSTELTFSVTPMRRLECAEIVASPGFARIDSLPGESLRDVRVTQDAETRDLVVEFQSLLDGMVHLDLFDATGARTGGDIEAMLGPGHRVVRMETGGLAVGSYFLRVRTGGSSQVVKLTLVP
jgi:hypothetical protein